MNGGVEVCQWISVAPTMLVPCVSLNACSMRSSACTSRDWLLPTECLTRARKAFSIPPHASTQHGHRLVPAPASIRRKLDRESWLSTPTARVTEILLNPAATPFGCVRSKYGPEPCQAHTAALEALAHPSMHAEEQ